jgi:acylpyruvate hydrolase
MSVLAAQFVRQGKKVLPVRRIAINVYLLWTEIVAIGRNYSEHIKELNNARTKEPFFFLKPTTSYLPTGGKLEIPGGVVAHHEGRLVILYDPIAVFQ